MVADNVKNWLLLFAPLIQRASDVVVVVVVVDDDDDDDDDDCAE